MNPSVFLKFSGIEKKYGREGAYHDLQSKTLCLTVPKTFVREPHSLWEKFWFQEVLWMKRGVSRFSVELFWSHSAENFRQRILLFLRKKLVWKSFMDEKGGITFLRRIILVSQCRKNSWASLQCFRKFGVSKNFMHNRDITFFRRIFFVSQSRNLSLENPSVSEKIFGFKKFYGWKRGYHVFPSESFGLTVPKNLVGTPSMFQKISGIEKFYA